LQFSFSSRIGIALALCVMLAAGDGQTAEWPTRAVRVVVPLTPGSAADVVPRIVFEQVSAQLGQAFVVENRAGASGAIGAHAVATSSPDGYTILAHSSAHVISKSTVANLSYDPLKDFSPVAPLGNLPNVLVVSPEKHIKTVQQLVSIGKEREITFGSIGVGSPIHLAMERFRLSAGFKARPITFRGAPEAMIEVMAGRVDAYYAPVLAALAGIRSGQLLPLAVSSPQRVSILPDVPTTEEAGYPESSYQFWLGVFAPAKTPPEIVARLNAEIEKALQVPAVKEKLESLGVQPMAMSPVKFTQFVEDQLEVNARLAKAAGIAPQ
jgi:tripartite-type tricarboxylate transporter receptor subunit TctC